MLIAFGFNIVYCIDLINICKRYAFSIKEKDIKDIISLQQNNINKQLSSNTTNAAKKVPNAIKKSSFHRCCPCMFSFLIHTCMQLHAICGIY